MGVKVPGIRLPRVMRGLARCAMAAACALALAPGAAAQPAYVTQGSLLPRILMAPERSWVPVNLNAFSDVWTPEDLRTLDNGSVRPPSKIILAWSGFGWDSNRGDLILYGGGHANYSGNDVYRWHSSDLLWERASLPSEIRLDPVAGFMAIDGPDRAPPSAHTYDNNAFLPIADRFLAWGGAAYNTGGPYLRVSETNPLLARQVGPYLFDPSKADGNKVGGSTGSHVRRVAPHPEIVGGNMWTNRDVYKTLAGQVLPGSYVNGCTAYANEGGRDVLYVGGRTLLGTSLDLYRYQLTSIGNPALDQMSVVGIFDVGTSDQTTCAYDAARKLLVRTGLNGQPFTYWDLTTPGTANTDKAVAIDSTIAGLQTWLAANNLEIQNCALESDPVRSGFLLWCGAGDVWQLRAPSAGNTPTGWTVTRVPATSAKNPPGESTGTGVLGKWRYAAYYDVYVGLEDPVDGNVWIYKPQGWVQPNAAGNALPTVMLLSPGNGATVAAGTAIPLTVAAADADGAVVRVEYYVNGVKVAAPTGAPFSASWTPILLGTYTVVAVAVDNAGGMKASAPATVNTTGTAVTATLQRSSGYAGVTDTYLDQTQPTVSLGAATELVAGFDGYVPLVRFSIFASEGGPVPNGALVQSATLRLYKQYYDFTFSLNALLSPWSESAATWQQRQAGIAWSTPGAGGAGSDFAATPDAVTNALFDPGWVSFDVTARVRQWASGQGSNYGWRIDDGASAGNVKLFEASEYTADPSLRPRLDVVYVTSSGNTAPSISITAPAGGSSVGVGTPVAIVANASDGNGSVVRVDCFVNGVKIGQDTAAPWTFSWTPAASGTYTLTAVATDNAGAQTTSSPISVSAAATNVPPTIALTAPASGANVTVGVPVPIAANAADVDGTVVRVEYFANALKIGQDTATPWTFSWTPATPGAYALRAVATDNAGAQTTSSPVTVNATSASVPATITLTSPATGATLPVGAPVTLRANAGDGGFARVDFYVNGAKVGASAAAPYMFAWTPVSAGVYQLAAVGVAASGATATSATVTVIAAVPNPSVNVALATNGGVASASSSFGPEYPASAVNDGDRSSARWWQGGGWADATPGVFPDWVQINFNGPKTIDRVVLYTLADVYGGPDVPQDGGTFTLYGVTAFAVEAWNGSAWYPVASVSGNNQVKRTVTFAAVTTDRIRVTVTLALQSFTRVIELEAWTSASGSTNFAAAVNGGVASASSTYGPAFPLASVNDGDRTALNWGHGGGWADATPGAFPDWVQIAFNGAKTIETVVLYTLPDVYGPTNAPQDTSPDAQGGANVPQDGDTFTRYGITAFNVDVWNGTNWITVANATGNTQVKRTVTFAPVTTDRIRLTVTQGLMDYARILELEAWGF